METVANYFSLYWLELILGFLTLYFCFGYFHYKNEVAELNDALNNACDLLDNKNIRLMKKEAEIKRITSDYFTERGIVDMQLKTIDELKEKYSRLEESKISDITQAMKNIFDYARGANNDDIIKIKDETIDSYRETTEKLCNRISELEKANDSLLANAIKLETENDLLKSKDKGEKIGQ